MSLRLRGKRCLVAGGTSGLGLAAADRFLEEGARVVIAGRSWEKGHDAVAGLQAKGQVHFVPCDAAQPAQVERLFVVALQQMGGLDVLYHVAGISGRRLGDGPVHECSDDGWRTTIDANLKSTFLTNRAAVRHFLEQRQAGVVLNMASVLALAPSPRYFDTCAEAASRGGIIAMSRLAAARYAPHAIRVNVLAPGLIDTATATHNGLDSAVRQFLISKQPLKGGPGEAADCCAAAVFLCSDEARFVTGVVLPVDGGWCVSEGQFGI